MGVGTIDQRRTLKACAGVHVVHDGLADMLYALLPVLAQSLGLSYAQVGVIRAANNLATVLKWQGQFAEAARMHRDTFEV